MNGFDLRRLFTQWNLKFFNGEMPVPELRWNSRLKTTAGRFYPDRKKPIIEIASYLAQEENAEELIWDTMGHEMIHYWLFNRRRPYGHNAEFYQKMEEIGVSRYNSAPKHRPFKHCYSCHHCTQKIWTRRRLSAAACAACCNLHSEGRFDPQFKLKLLDLSLPQDTEDQVVELPKRA
jgi:predicted SprT family Zn-dependent metalloprotease